MIAHAKERWYKRAWRKVKSIFTKRRLFEATYFVAGTVVSAYVMYQTLPLWLAALIFGTLFAHEFGHYFAARRAGREVRMPFFIPLYYGMQGGTRVKGQDPETDMDIALAGPKVGIAVTCAALVGFGFAGFMPGVWASLWILAFQLYSGTIGHDGRKYWRARSIVGASEPVLTQVAVVV